jgi:HMG (high mobility group) box
MAKIAEDWKELSLDGKAVWEQRAVEDKERYHREMQAYTGPLKVRYTLLPAPAPHYISCRRMQLAHCAKQCEHLHHYTATATIELSAYRRSFQLHRTHASVH